MQSGLFSRFHKTKNRNSIRPWGAWETTLSSSLQELLGEQQ
jgi:hypothetical protein